MSIYKRGEIWWTRFTDANKRRVAKSLGVRTEREAKKIESQFINSYRQVEKQGHTLEQALILWLKFKPRSSPEKSSLKTFLSRYPSRPLHSVNGHDIQDALSDLNPATYNRTVNNVRAAINMAADRNWCKPIKVPRKKVIKKTPRFLTKEEWLRLERELPAHIKPIVIFALATGLRKSNVLNLRWESIDLDNKVAWIGAENAKGKKTISIPLSDAALDVLNRQTRSAGGYVFTFNGVPIGDPRVSWKNALERAEIHNFRWHDLRHTWASWHIQSGTTLAALKELGGWADVSMVMVYAHLAPEHLAQYANNSHL